MLFDAIRRRRQEKADSQQAWLARWQSLVPEENRNVPVTVEGQTRIAYIQINQFVVMLQDGLLMKAHFFRRLRVFFRRRATTSSGSCAVCRTWRAAI